MKKDLFLLEGIYAYYMWNNFKTNCYIHHPLEKKFLNNMSKFFKHPIESRNYESKICPLGNLVGLLLLIYIILRYLFNWKYKKLDNLIFTSIFVCSLLLNLNAFIYYIPIFIYEYYRYHYL